jgi:hypothetical protein
MPPQRQDQTSESPPTTLEQLRRHSDEVREVVERLLDRTTIRYHDINAGSSVVFVFGWMPHRWGPPKEGAQRYFGEARQQWQVPARPKLSNRPRTIYRARTILPGRWERTRPSGPQTWAVPN